MRLIVYFYFFIGLCLSIFLIYSVKTLIAPVLYQSSNVNLIAAKVRDEDERRLAFAISQIGEWRLLKKLPISSRKFSPKSRKAYNFLALVVTSDRNRQRIDAFNPQYLTQTVIGLVREVQNAPASEFSNFGKFKTAVCSPRFANESESDSFASEIWRMRDLLGNPNILRHAFPETVDSHCRDLLSWQMCLSLGLAKNPTVAFIILLEDDFIATKSFLFLIHQFIRFVNRPFHAPLNAALQLYVDADVQPYDSGLNAILILAFFASSLPFLISLGFVCLRSCPQGSLKSFVLLGVLLCLIIIASWQLVKVFQSEAVIISSLDTAAPATGAAILLPRSIAESLSNQTIALADCRGRRKSEFIASFFERRGTLIYSAPAPAVRHIGMYSNRRGKLLNPFLFPH